MFLQNVVIPGSRHKGDENKAVLFSLERNTLSFQLLNQLTSQVLMWFIMKINSYNDISTCVRWAEVDCDFVARFLWLETNQKSQIPQHEDPEPGRHSSVLAGAELDVSDEHRLQQAGHHQRQGEGEEDICGKQWQQNNTKKEDVSVSLFTVFRLAFFCDPFFWKWCLS